MDARLSASGQAAKRESCPPLDIAWTDRQRLHGQSNLHSTSGILHPRRAFSGWGQSGSPLFAPLMGRGPEIVALRWRDTAEGEVVFWSQVRNEEMDRRRLSDFSPSHPCPPTYPDDRVIGYRVDSTRTSKRVAVDP
ncbi:hypothetical protein ACOMHN_029687 [Nucella lapillus]